MRVDPNLIMKTLKRMGFNAQDTADELGIDVSTVYTDGRRKQGFLMAKIALDTRD